MKKKRNTNKIRKKTLRMVSPLDIAPNPYNPRLIFEEEELKELKRSIDKVGILVPLTIFENKKKVPRTKYILLDGERRWRCSKELGLKKIQANIIDEPKDVTQNILFMFNIHHFRREWELFPTALKLEVIIKKLRTDRESTLSHFTGVSRPMIRRCKMLLWYPEKYRNILMHRDGKISTDFFIELYPIAYRLSQEEEFRFPDRIKFFIDSAKKKFLDNLITDVKEFREIRKCMAYYEDINKFGDFFSRINNFTKEDEVSIEIFAVPDLEEGKTRRNIIKYVSYLNESLKTVNPGLISDIYFAEQLKLLKRNLDRVIENID